MNTEPPWELLLQYIQLHPQELDSFGTVGLMSFFFALFISYQTYFTCKGNVRFVIHKTREYKQYCLDVSEALIPDKTNMPRLIDSIHSTQLHQKVSIMSVTEGILSAH